MKAIQMYQKATKWLSNLSDLPPLFFRLILAYGFYGPAMMKWKNIGNVAEWFGSLGIPVPTLNAYLAASTEMAGVVLLALGLGTRLISIPLIFTMIVAIVTVHLGNGFEAGDNGFEIPLYYILMLFSLFVNGAGKFSLDNLLAKKC
jgi:putative oxidoreductase